MLTDNYSLDYVSDIELESINNFITKESIEIILEEVDYFFCSKESLVELFIEGIDLNKLTIQNAQERFHRTFYSTKDIENFILKIEKRLNREFARVQTVTSINLSPEIENFSNVGDSLSLMSEEIKTLKMSCSTAKGIDFMWKKSTAKAIPVGLKRFTSQIKIGDYFLSTVGLSPKEIKESILIKMAKRLRGILKQNKVELTNHLKSEIIKQLLEKSSNTPNGTVKLEVIRTA